MSHDEVERVLEAYAAGTMSHGEATRVRGHLLECSRCRDALFRLGVGIPRSVEVPADREPSWGPGRLAIVGVTAAIAGAAIPALVVLGFHARSHADVLAAAEARHLANVQVLSQRVAGAEEQARRAADHLAVAEAARVAAEAALARGTLPPDPPPTSTSTTVPSTTSTAPAVTTTTTIPAPTLPAPVIHRETFVRDRLDGVDRLLAGPGARVIALSAVARGRARGHVLWRSGVDEGRLFVFGLPSQAEGYRVIVRGRDGERSTPLEGPLGRVDHGVPIPVPGTIDDVLVVREATGETLLRSAR